MKHTTSAENEMGKHIGKWAFLVGLLAAVVISVMAGTGVPLWAILLLAIDGIIVGVLNVTEDEASEFLIAAIAFMVSFMVFARLFGEVLGGFPVVGVVFTMLNVFIAPAALIVALKVMFDKARDE
jgi:hypothetical protein